MERLNSHPQSPSAKFAKFHAALVEHAVRTAAERTDRERELHNRTEYKQRAEQGGQ